MAYDYDLFVIGGGSGGVRAARLAGARGLKVALAEEDRMGGTCVIRGCVPKKLMVYASAFSDAFVDAAAFGWHVGRTAFEWPKLLGAINAELDRLEGLYRHTLTTNHVVVMDERAQIAGAHKIQLASGKTVTARRILIATGARPFVPPVAGHEFAVTSNEVFHLDDLPPRILIVGGGYIACEFAGIFNGLGARVKQFYRGAQILRGFDDEVRGHVAEDMRGKGVDLHVGTDVECIEKTDDGYTVRCTNGTDSTVDVVLYATGRTPNSAGLGLQELGIAVGRNGEIPVDEFSQTSVKSIYAIGDVTDRMNLTPVAIHDAVSFINTVYGDQPTPVDHDLVATAVFTQPEIGTVGMTEEDARDAEAIEVYAATFRPMQHSLAGRGDRTLMKLIVARASRKVLGCHIVGQGAAEMIQMAGVAVKMGATKEDFDRTMAIHPTVAEELVTMSEPVRVA